MARRTIPYEDILYQDLQDPEEAVAYLNAALDDEYAQGAQVFLLEPSVNRLSRRRSSRQRISVARFGPEECAHYFTHAGHAST